MKEGASLQGRLTMEVGLSTGEADKLIMREGFL